MSHYVGGYAIFDFSESPVTIATDTGSQTLTDLDALEVVKLMQMLKPVYIANLTITANSAVKQYSGFAVASYADGVHTYTLGNVTISAPTETSVTVTLSA